MAPIHDTDVAEERWQSASWRNFELWERIEVRLKRRRVLLVALTLVLFFALSSIPIVIERGPKWRGQVAARKLSQEVVAVRREAASLRVAMDLAVDSVSGAYVVRRATSCAQVALEGAEVRRGTFFEAGGSLRLLTEADAARFGLASIVTHFCYDPEKGSSASQDSGFVVIPEVDFAPGRSDRISAALIRGASAEPIFD